MKFSKFDMRMFNEAHKEAMKSTYKRRSQHVGAVITYKGHIIGRGCNSNKTHPLQKEFNRYRDYNNADVYSPDKLHAEISAICSISYTVGINVRWDKANIYIYRPMNDTKMACAKPCPACMNAIKSLGIRHIYYTDSNGYSYLQLDV